MSVKWREVFKFLSGAAFAGSVANLYLAVYHVAVPVLGYTISPRVLGIRGVVGLVLCVVFFYFGYVRK